MSTQLLFLEILRRFLQPGENETVAVDELRTAGELLAMGRMHSLYPAVYEVVQGTEGFAALPEQQRLVLRKEARQKVIGQTMRTSLFLGVYQRLLTAGVTPLVVKGLVLRQIYPMPDHRASSDEDLLVKREEFWQADASLVAQGFQRSLPEEPLQAHEITYWHPKTGVHLELHLSLFPEDSEAYGRLNQIFKDAFAHQVVEEILGVGIHTLAPTEHMLYLLCHGLKHFLHSGFGIRQVCDMVMFAQHYGAAIDWQWIEAQTRQQGMYIFWMNLFDLGERYLGFRWEQAGLARPGDVVLDSEAMLEDILGGGIYGQSSTDRIHSANITLQAATGKKKAGLRKSLFPSLDYMRTKYPYLSRQPWLLPVAWGQRVVGYLSHTDRKEITQTVEIGQRRVALLKQYGLIDRE